MDGIQVDVQSAQQVGEAWIRALVEKDFSRLAEICQPDVRSRLMTPKRYDSYENAGDLTQKVDTWFGKCYSIQRQQVRVAMVGEKLGIFYRLGFEKEGEPCTAEQQVYCSLRDGLIDTVSLVCSGFQPLHSPLQAPIASTSDHPTVRQDTPGASPLRADAFLKVDTVGGKESTCAILTPAIKSKLGELSSGQVLEVNVDDPSAKEEIETWCRLTGNTLLRVDPGLGQELHFYLQKK